MGSARLIRAFVEDYHEKLEEDYLFPRFKKANKLVDLTDVLLQQHHKGRALTDRTMQLATATALKHSSPRATLRDLLYQFVRMYEPHEAREDTVLFPAFRKIVSKHGTTRSARISRRRRTRSFTATDSRRTSTLSPSWRKNSESTTWLSSPPRSDF
jgi:hemerythrin-like domain-containing protein